MFKEKFFFVAGIILVALAAYALTHTYVMKADYRFSEEISKIESNLGKEVIIMGDTLKLVDYSLFKNTYTLSDGSVININLIEKLK